MNNGISRHSIAIRRVVSRAFVPAEQNSDLYSNRSKNLIGIGYTFGDARRRGYTVTPVTQAEIGKRRDKDLISTEYNTEKMYCVSRSINHVANADRKTGASHEQHHLHVPFQTAVFQCPAHCGRNGG